MAEIAAFIEKWLDKENYKSFVLELSKEYLTTVFEKEVETINLEKLVDNSLPKISEVLYKMVNNLWGSGKPAYYDISEMYEYGDNKLYDVVILEDYIIFYEYYTIFGIITDHHRDFVKGELPNGDCYCGTDINSLTNNFKMDLLTYFMESVKENLGKN